MSRAPITPAVLIGVGLLACAWGTTAAVPTPSRPLTDPRAVISPAVPDARPVSAADLFYTRGVADAAWTRDGQALVVSTNLTGRYNLWRVPVNGGFPLQLTQSDDRQSGIATSPDGLWAVYDSDHAGDEIYDLHRVSLTDGRVEDLTATAEVTETGARFSPDGAKLAFDRRLKSASATDVAVMDLASRTVRILTHEATPDHQWSVVGFTSDGRRLIAVRTDFNATQAETYSVDTTTGALARLSPAGAPYVRASDVSPDGRTLAVTYETADGVRRAGVLDLHSGRLKPVQPEVWEQEAGRFSPDGRTLLFSRNRDGRVTLGAYAVAEGRVAAVGPEDGVNREISQDQTSVSPDGAQAAFVHQGGSTPPNIWIAPLAAGAPARQVTRLGLASIDPARLPRTQIVRYAGDDGTIISALLWVPLNRKRDGSAPAIVLPHGGPTGQTQDSYNRTAVALASRGYFVIAPNPRGSTGYGRAFQAANHKDLGGGDLRDELGAVRFLLASGYVDPRRIGITGGSYGGYMTVMAAAKAPNVWAAAVEEYGILDWVAMYRSEAPTLQSYQTGLIGDPEHDAEVYRATSPLTYVHALRAPLLILQGDNDIRVPKGQAIALETVLKADGRTVDAHFYPNEGHGFEKRENQIDALQRTLAWFDRYLRPAAGAEAASR